MPVLKVGESRYFQAALLVEKQGPPPEYPGGAYRVLNLPQERSNPTDPIAEFGTSGDGVISIVAERDMVKVTGVSGGKSTLNVKAYYPDDATAYQECAVEFIVLAAGSPNDIFGACLLESSAA